MHIWIINHYAYTPDDTSGTRHYSLAKKLIARGHRVHLLASSFYHGSYEERRIHDKSRWKLENLYGVPYLWIKTPPYRSNSFARIWNMLSFSLSLYRGKPLTVLPEPDIIIGSSPDLFAASAALAIAKRRNVPFLFEVRDIWPLAQVEIAKVHPKHPFILFQEMLESRLYRQADAIISLLPNAAEHMVQNGAKASKIVYIPNGIDLDLIPSPSNPPDSNIFRIMYAGSHGPKNGIDTILDAAVILMNNGYGDKVIIELIGDGSEKTRLIQRVINERIKIVTFKNSVPKKDVYAELVRANGFIVNRHNHPINRFGVSLNKFFDYLAMARPTILGSDAYNNPFEESHSGITVKPGNPIELATAIEKLISMNSRTLWQMGLKGREYVEKHHNMDTLAEKLENVLFRLTSY
jgi:glycosyltransferase involved in cell wall biosynthesis